MKQNGNLSERNVSDFVRTWQWRNAHATYALRCENASAIRSFHFVSLPLALVVKVFRRDSVGGIVLDVSPLPFSSVLIDKVFPFWLLYLSLSFDYNEKVPLS